MVLRTFDVPDVGTGMTLDHEEVRTSMTPPGRVVPSFISLHTVLLRKFHFHWNDVRRSDDVSSSV